MKYKVGQVVLLEEEKAPGISYNPKRFKKYFFCDYCDALHPTENYFFDYCPIKNYKPKIELNYDNM